MSYLLEDAPDSLTSSVRPEEGTASIQSARIQLVDADGAITAIAESLEGRTTSLHMGFLGLAESEYITFPVGFTDEVQYRDGVWQITVRDPFSKLTQQIFGIASSRLSADVGEEDAIVPLVAAMDYEDSGYAIIGGSEIISYASRTDNSLNGCLRHLFGTAATNHSKDTTVAERLRIQMHPADFLLQLATGAGKFGVGLASTFIDTARFADLKVNTDPSLRMEWWVDRPRDAYTVFEETCRSLTAYPATNAQGLLTVQDYREPNTNDVLITLSTEAAAAASEQHILDSRINPRVVSRSRNTRINSVSFLANKNRLNGALTETETYEDATSIAEFGRWHISIPVEGLRDELPGAPLYKEVRSMAIFRRYADNSSRITLRLLLAEHLRIAGELVQLTHRDLPDVRGGTLGITNRYYEIVQRKIFFPKKDGAGGFVEIEAEDTGYTELTPVISALAIEVGAATQDQLDKYSWVGDGEN